MFNTAYTFGLTQFARSLSLPERLQKRPFRNATLEPWRFRNSSLDAMFYDIKTLTSDEAFYISDSLAAEGMLMIVPPTGKGMLTLCDTVDEYLLRGGLDVHVMAVAGIGGSAAGAAAFARNVADAVDAPVAAVVSGYGLGDIISEAMGSNFLFGPLGFLRHNFEMIDDLVGRPQLGDYARHRTTANSPRRSSLDTDTVEALLMNDKLDFNLITGHSKGNLIIAEALRSLETAAPERLESLGEKLKLVSFATRIAVPPALSPAVAIMGELDWYGELNATAPAAGTIRVPRSGHSTNTDMPGSLKITSLLRDALRDRPATPAEAVMETPPSKEPPVLHLVETAEEPAPDVITEPSETADVTELPVTEATVTELQANEVQANEAPVAEAPVAEAAVNEVEHPAAQAISVAEDAPVIEEAVALETIANESDIETETMPVIAMPEPEAVSEEAVIVGQKAAIETSAPSEATKTPGSAPKTRNKPRSTPRRNRKI